MFAGKSERPLKGQRSLGPVCFSLHSEQERTQKEQRHAHYSTHTQKQSFPLDKNDVYARRKTVDASSIRPSLRKTNSIQKSNPLEVPLHRTDRNPPNPLSFQTRGKFQDTAVLTTPESGHSSSVPPFDVNATSFLEMETQPTQIFLRSSI